MNLQTADAAAKKIGTLVSDLYVSIVRNASGADDSEYSQEAALLRLDQFGVLSQFKRIVSGFHAGFAAGIFEPIACNVALIEAHVQSIRYQLAEHSRRSAEHSRRDSATSQADDAAAKEIETRLSDQFESIKRHVTSLETMAVGMGVSVAKETESLTMIGNVVTVAKDRAKTGRAKGRRRQ